MPVRTLATFLATGLLLAGCARWAPQHGPGLVRFDHACLSRRPPAVPGFGPAGVRAVYHFAAGGSSSAERGAFIHAAETTGFNVIPIMVEMNGVDTLIVQGRALLNSQQAVDREFGAACRLRQPNIYLSHVRHDPAGQTGSVRVR